MNQLSLMPVRVRIASEMRKAIYAGEYKSGDELSLTAVAMQLGISRTPVREAFQELEAEGLITLRMNRGAVVNTIDRKFVQDFFEVRRLLESEAVARAAANGMETGELLERLYPGLDYDYLPVHWAHLYMDGRYKGRYYMNDHSEVIFHQSIQTPIEHKLLHQD